MQYHLSIQRLRLFTGIVAVSLFLAACHGGSSGTAPYVPSSSLSSQAGDQGLAPNDNDRGEIRPSCGHHVHIVLAGIINCRFHEIGDRDALFTLKNDTHGLILISPMSGNRHTKFTITGLVVGSGHFTVRAKGDPGHVLVVTVKVTL